MPLTFLKVEEYPDLGLLLGFHFKSCPQLWPIKRGQAERLTLFAGDINFCFLGCLSLLIGNTLEYPGRLALRFNPLALESVDLVMPGS